jgi:iron(II)-dependent oxidoreductase
MSKQRPGSTGGKKAPGEKDELRTEVHLKPFLGMRPGAYLTVIYALLALVILFFLLFYKGIRDQGTFLRVHSVPAGAAVAVDGQYAGSTPCEVLVKRGTRKIEASRPFFQPAVLEAYFRGPVFGTLFVRPRRDWNPGLKVADAQGLAISALQEFAANPNIPEILTQTVAASFTSDAEAHAVLATFLDRAKYFVSSSRQLDSYLKALAVLDAHGRVLSPASLIETVQQIASTDDRFTNLPFWLTVVLPQKASQAFQKAAWYQDFVKKYFADIQQLQNQLRASTFPSASAPFGLAGLTFRAIPAGTLLAGSLAEATATQLPYAVRIAAFFASETEVPNRVYRQFVDANPQWSKKNTAELIAKGWVDGSYLSSWTEAGYPPGADNLPVTNVSWFAAEAFCRWLSSALPASLAGHEARLPYEAEWEWAARGGLVGYPYPLGSEAWNEVFFEPGIKGPRPVGTSSPNGYGLRDACGNVWEWCSDWFSPVAYLFTSREPAKNSADRSAEIPYGAEKVVRGGSWANDRELVKVYTRASQPPSWCTPYLGFRVVLARARS